MAYNLNMKQSSIFESDLNLTPLAARIKPTTLEEFIGQKHILGKGKLLRNLIEHDQIGSVIFWGTSRCW